MKTTEEMLEYAKSIVDNDENAYILFLVHNVEAYVKIKSNMTNKCEGIYKSLGTIVFGITPINHHECCGKWGGMQITHLFLADIVDNDVYAYLRSKLRTAKTLKEPIGVYHRWHVERWGDY